MNCGIPYCHNGCPVNNQIPDWNDLVYRGDWREASRNLHSTNNFPEFTGRVCPAPCEASCTLNIQDTPVTIKTIECAIVDRAWEQGWIKPEPPSKTTGKRVAVVGSGPAGLACAQQLARVGHEVHLYEKNAQAGGLLRYGIPDFKLEKRHIERRVEQMKAEGVVFHCKTHVGKDVTAAALLEGYDAIALAGGAEHRRATCPCRGATSTASITRWSSCRSRTAASPASRSAPTSRSSPAGKHVVVIGGGDTGSDCIGTSIRQGALKVTQLEIMPTPPQGRGQDAELAELAGEAAHLVEPRGGRRARLRGDDAQVRGRERRRHRHRMHPARRQAEADRGHASSPSRPISCCWRWASCRRSRRGCSPISA